MSSSQSDWGHAGSRVSAFAPRAPQQPYDRFKAEIRLLLLGARSRERPTNSSQAVWDYWKPVFLILALRGPVLDPEYFIIFYALERLLV